MAEFADRILELVAQPDYKPITLKAMSRRFEVDRRRLRRVPRGGQAARSRRGSSTSARTRRCAGPIGLG